MRCQFFLTSVIVCLLANGLVAQSSSGFIDCSSRMIEETDSNQGTYSRRFTDLLFVSSGPDTLRFEIKQFNEALVISVLVIGAGDCLDETSKMIVKFSSGQAITLPMDGRFNCDREFAVFFGGAFGKKKEFRMLLTNQIEFVRIETRQSVVDKTRKPHVEVKLNEFQQQDFSQRLACLVGD